MDFAKKEMTKKIITEKEKTMISSILSNIIKMEAVLIRGRLKVAT